MTDGELRKAVVAQLKDVGPHRAAEKLGVSAFLLVMFGHGYSRLQKAKREKLELILSKRPKAK